MTKTPKIAAVLIARQGSSRLPGKALAEIMGRPVIAFILERLKDSGLFSDICLATSNLPIDEPLAALAEKLGFKAYRGHPTDVLDRMYGAAKLVSADVVFEIGGDCPFVDADIVKKGLDLFLETGADYVCNADPQTYPDGLDVHIVKFSALEFAHKNAILASQRVHPFSYFHKHLERFKCLNFTHETNLSAHRWTLDYQEDFELIDQIFKALYPQNPRFKMNDILALIRQKPELSKINANRNLPHATDAVPAYWFTRAYIQDVLKDIESLAKTCAVLEVETEQTKNYEPLSLYYSELTSLAQELKQRIEYFGKNNQKR